MPDLTPEAMTEAMALWCTDHAVMLERCGNQILARHDAEVLREIAARLRQPREEVRPHNPDSQPAPGPDTPPASPLHKEQADVIAGTKARVAKELRRQAEIEAASGDEWAAVYLRAAADFLDRSTP